MQSADKLPSNVLSRDIYVLEKYLQLYQNIRKKRKAPYSSIRLSYSQLFHLVETGELLRKAGKYEVKFSLTEIVKNQIECYEENNQERFPDHVLEKYGFRRAELSDAVADSPKLKIVPKAPVYSEGVLEPLDAYYCEIKGHIILKREEEPPLIRRAQQGDKEAEKEMIECNQKLVAAIARRFKWSEMSLLDLIQAGNLGLYRAIQKFDVDGGNKFSTYATGWIKQGIWREIKSKKTSVRMPEYLYSHIRILRGIQTHYLSSKDRPPSLDEICSETGWSEKEAGKVLKAAAYLSSTEDTYAISQLSTKDDMIKRLLIIRLKELFPHLSKKEQDLLTRRYGLNGCPAETLEEVGIRYGFTRERARQVEEEALDFFRFHFGIPTKRVDYVNRTKHLKKRIVDMQKRSRVRKRNIRNLSH